MKELNNNEIMQKWYQFASKQPDFVDSLLALLRERQKKTLEEQRLEFGASEAAFTKLRGMKLPRAEVFMNDAQRIAEACKLSNPFAFVNALNLANKLKRSRTSSNSGNYYEAAFDEVEDLDNISEES